METLIRRYIRPIREQRVMSQDKPEQMWTYKAINVSHYYESYPTNLLSHCLFVLMSFIEQRRTPQTNQGTFLSDNRGVSQSLINTSPAQLCRLNDYLSAVHFQKCCSTGRWAAPLSVRYSAKLPGNTAVSLQASAPAAGSVAASTISSGA